MKLIILTILLFICFAFAPAKTFAEEKETGQPLYFPAEKFGGHPDDAAPESDPVYKKKSKNSDEVKTEEVVTPSEDQKKKKTRSTKDKK